jgi:hypothetical protein
VSRQNGLTTLRNCHSSSGKEESMMMNKVTSDNVLLLDFHIVQYIPKCEIDPF